MKRTAFVIALLVWTCASSRSIAETAPAWSPVRPVRIVVPFQAGGPIDAIARIVAQQLNEKWGQSFVIENRTGAGGNIGMELVAKAPADGYTLGTASGGTHGANATLYGSRLPFDPRQRFYSDHDARGDEEHPRGSSLSPDKQPARADCLRQGRTGT